MIENLDRKPSRRQSVLLRVAAAALAVTTAMGRAEPSIAQNQIVQVIKTYDQCGGTLGLEDYAPDVDVFVTQALMSDGTTRFFNSVFSVGEDCPVSDRAQSSLPLSVPVVASCMNIEVPLGTTSGNGAVVNEYTATQRVIAHGDLEINGEFRADSNGATGLIQDVNASPSNPARIRTVNPAWGGDVAFFCIPEHMAANIQQGVDNLRRQGMRADVLSWPGPKQR